VLEHHRAPVAALHGADPLSGAVQPAVWWCDPTDAAVALGSRQGTDTVDAAACATRGLEVVRRRSGGGAVLLRPDAVVWVDIVVPHGVAPDDVRGSMIWAGHAWRGALADVGIELGATVHEGGMVGGAWCDLVCFAGIGPGEVLVGDSKLVGLSQRRTRHGLRIQGMVHRRPLNDDVLAVLTGPLPAEPLPRPAAVPGLDAHAIARALAHRITAV
jgi:hypothetical protein